MPVIVLEARDFASPLFLVRTWALLSGCLTFSLVASLEASELNGTPSGLHQMTTFRISCMFTWCFFFIFTLLIHVLNIIQFHSLIPISWKNLTVTVAVLGALMCLSASVVFPWIVMDHDRASPHAVVAAVASCLTSLAYTSESYVIRSQAQEQRGYMASMPGLLKILQFWGGCQMIPLLVEAVHGFSSTENGRSASGVEGWQLWVSGMSYCLCVLMSLVTVVVILGDCTGRCLIPFDRILATFSLSGVLLYMVATVICFTKVTRLRHNSTNADPELVVLETVVASITLLAYTVDLACSIKLLCDRSHA
ncbi:myeloid-associated differentiation marker homolog [Myripristis murdjan]|uniref:myeloid-associated differentiation marker homolog n=1 Tax=Myripristis murdjan TaxID=586833 RepID=UPI00117635B7|nr:myeloid-associated differentiation marker homolog [Myripristis murdjan]